jgi:DNA-binding NarL/FixJ family response regulator
LLVDDHPITRQGLRVLFNQQTDLEICGEADDGALGFELACTLKPDIIIIDVSLKSQSGIELVKNIKARVPDARMLVLSMHDENVYAERAMRAGAMGYAMKHEDSERLIEAVRIIVRGGIHLSAAMKEKMLHRYVNKRGDPAEFSIDTLSDREMEVLQAIGNGFSSREVAKKLNLSTKTIDSYREHLKKKLNLDTGADVVRYAIEYVRNSNG